MVIGMLSFGVGAQNVDTICGTQTIVDDLTGGCYTDDWYSHSVDPTLLESFPPITINVHFWGINKDDGTSSDPLTVEKILAVIDNLNAACAEMNICFNLKGYDYIDETDIYAPTYGVLKNYLDAHPNYKDNNSLNIYATRYLYRSNGNVLRGIAWQEDQMAAVRMQSVITEGGLLIHEVGHLLGLAHTFIGCENVTRDPNDPNFNADCAGDEVVDTNAVSSFFEPTTITHQCQYIGAGTDCQGTPYVITETDVRNYMGYTYDECRSIFTIGQGIRVRETISYSEDYSYTNVVNIQNYDFFMRNSLADVGAEPDNNSEVNIWKSPDIWIRNQPDGIETHQNPEYDPNNPPFIYVRITNKGCGVSPDNAQLKLYWAKANTFFNWPTYWTGYVENGLIMSGEFTPVTIPVVAAGEETVIEIPWNNMPNPNLYEPMNSNSDKWHFCLLARIVSTDDPMFNEVDGPINPNVRNNNNIAWKNLTVLDDLLNIREPGGVVAVGNPFNTAVAYNFEFLPKVDETGPLLHEEAEIRVEMGSKFYDAWVQGGEKMEGMKNGRMSNTKIITNPYAVLKNAKFDPHEMGTVFLKFNFLTEKVSSKPKFVYNIIQRKASNGNVLGGETYEIVKEPRAIFLAQTNSPTTQIDSTIYTATSINELAIYNWYDPDGNLISSGTSLILDSDKFGKYTLEVVADADGYKDYYEIDIKNPLCIKNLAPNPATGQVTISYQIGSGNSAYLMLTNFNSTISNNYILDEAQHQIDLDLSGYQPGIYIVSLICNGEITDSKNLVIQ